MKISDYALTTPSLKQIVKKNSQPKLNQMRKLHSPFQAPNHKLTT